MPICRSLEVSLNDATYCDGVFSTKTGGIITADQLHIQAKYIQYTQQNGKKEIDACEDILVTFGNKVFVGERVFYDFISKKGVIYKGKISIGIWHISGSQIELYPDDTYRIFNAVITTSEKQNPLFAMCGKRVDIEKNLLIARPLQLQCAGRPYLILPKYSTNLQRLWKKPLLQYKLSWDKGLGPAGMIRYRIYDSKNFNSHLRFDARVHKKEKSVMRLGSSLETEYFFLKNRGQISAQNYLGYDVFFNDPHSSSHLKYRLQGLASYKSLDGNRIVSSRWDKISDKNMANDFQMEKFELSTGKKTELKFINLHQKIITNVSFVPRINSFDSMKQELPDIKLSPYPIIFKNSGVVFENSLRAGYYKYSFDKDSHPDCMSPRSSKLHYRQALYRSFSSPYLTIVPKVGCHYLLYGNRDSTSALQFCMPFVDISLHSKLLCTKDTIIHSVEPYAKSYSLLAPAKGDYPPIFDLSDGWRPINQLRFGIRSDLWKREPKGITPLLSVDSYALGFVHPSPFAKVFPKIFTTIEYSLPRFSIKTLLGWNMEFATLDLWTIRGALTCNADCAISAEFRFRGPMSWRKSNPDNYILDVTRSPLDLTDSLLSDERKVALLRMQFKLHPQWIVRLEGNYGWGRKEQENHFVGKIDLLGLLSSNVRVKLSYLQAASQSHFEFGISLVRF